ncbi:hypothetical protein TSMEX_009046 [Taenia solium]|eukprot:TsM_001137600 transcript=TsM_001137600 gene=TsM_001137600
MQSFKLALSAELSTAPCQNWDGKRRIVLPPLSFAGGVKHTACEGYAVIMRAVNLLLSVNVSSVSRGIISLHEAQLLKSFFVLNVKLRVNMAIVVVNESVEKSEKAHIRYHICRLCDCIQMTDLCRSLHKSA